MSEQNPIRYVVETTKLTVLPFKNMKKIRSHEADVYDFTIVLFPNGKKKIITCSHDCTLRIFDLESGKCEKVIEHPTHLFSVHFYKEKQVLLTTDCYGELIIWNIFSPEIKIMKRVEISRKYSQLWRLTQVSSNLFFCCVKEGPSNGNLYEIKFGENRNDIDSEIKQMYYNFDHIEKELFCIHKLKSKKNVILFSGNLALDMDSSAIKKYNFVTEEHFSFKKKHRGTIQCLTSFINTKNREIVLSGSDDRKIVFWNLENGQSFKEIKLEGPVFCFLNDFRRNNIYVAAGGYYSDEYSLHSLNLRTKKLVSIENVHDNFIYCTQWIDEENQREFISCSEDYTFNIYELEKLPNQYEKNDIIERIGFIRDEEFLENYFCSEDNKKLLFSVKIWNNFEIKDIFKVFLL